MHAFVYASLILLLKSPLSVIAKPIASGDDLSADYSLFSGGDGSSTGTGDESDLFAATDNLSDLSGAGSSCSAEVGLLDGDDSLLGLDPSNDLVVRELDDNLFVAGKTPTTCVDKPVGQNQNPEPELDIPKLGLPANSNEQNNKCGGYNGRSLLACCDYSTTESPTNCQACTWGAVHWIYRFPVLPNGLIRS